MNIRRTIYLILSLSALTFLFFLGYPFGNHNESYQWIVDLRNMDLGDALVKPIRPISNFRPLGNVFAWLTFKAASNEIWLQQLCNWLLTLVAWSMLFFASKGKAFFSLVALVVTGAFFTGYIFLFHLHGVFYGPLLIYEAVLLILSDRERSSKRESVLLFLLTLAVALVHPFALVIYAFFLLASTWEPWTAKDRPHLILNAVLLCLTVVEYKFLVPPMASKTVETILHGFVVTYQMAEINKLLSVAAYLLSLLTLITLEVSAIRRAAYAAIVTVISLIFMVYHLPVVLVWIGTVLFKCFKLREWRVASIVLGTAILPLARETGSPTYAIFVLMASAYMTAWGFEKFERGLLSYYRIPMVFVACLVVLFFVMKGGARIPVVTPTLNPILAEQERSLQLEEIIHWDTTAAVPKRLELFDEAKNPSASSEAIDRRHRAPTTQDYLDIFLREYAPGIPIDTSASAPDSLSYVITFGDKEIKGRQVVFLVPGLRSGTAYVYQ